MISSSFFIRENAVKIKIITGILAVSMTLASIPSFAKSNVTDASEEDKSYIIRAMEYHKRSMADKKAMGATDEEMAFFRATSAIGIATTFIFNKCSGIASDKNSFKECKRNAKDLATKLLNDFNKEHGAAELTESDE